MQTKFLPLAVAALLLGAAGCYSFEAAPVTEAAKQGFRLHAGGGEPVAHVLVVNEGWYIFNKGPLVTGNALEKRWLPFHFFRNDVNTAVLQDRLTKYAAAQGCDVADLTVLNEENVFLNIPGFDIPLFIPYVATNRRLQLSATLVKHAAVSTVETDAARRRAMAREMKLLVNEIPNGGNE